MTGEDFSPPMPPAFWTFGGWWLRLTRLDCGIWWLGITPWLVVEFLPAIRIVKFGGREWGPDGEKIDDGR